MIKRKSNPEDNELIAFFQYVRLKESLGDERFGAIWHTENKKKTSFYQGKRLKAKGQKAGVWDMTVAVPTKNAPGLFIEMKYGSNVLSDSQIAFGDLMRNMGYKTHIAYSANEAITALEVYLKDQ